MKKLLVIMFLMLGALSYASSGKIVKLPVVAVDIVKFETTVVDDAAIYCCTISARRYCGHLGENSCATLRKILGIQ